MAEPKLEAAKQVIGAAEDHAREIEQPMVITVANSEGNLVAQHRMDGAWPAAVSISRNKAYTAAVLQQPTQDLPELSQPGDSLYGLRAADEERIVTVAGGHPLEKEGEVVGAIGVSGGEESQEQDVTEAGVDKWGKFSLKALSRIGKDRHVGTMTVNPGLFEGKIDPSDDEVSVVLRQPHSHDVPVENIDRGTLRFGVGTPNDVRNTGGVPPDPDGGDIRDDNSDAFGEKKLVLQFPIQNLDFGGSRGRPQVKVSTVFETKTGEKGGYDKEVELI